jgi:protein gp37
MITASPPDTARSLGLLHAIGWCDLTFNWGIYGCAMVSPACGTADGSSMCYASVTAERLIRFAEGRGEVSPYAGLVRDGRWTGEVRVDTARIPVAFGTLPKRPRRDGRLWRVFGSMFDPFHKDVPFDFLDASFAQMEARPWIAFQLLTKRADRMAAYAADRARRGLSWPRNVWAGATVEDQRRADERIAHLRSIYAAVRFLSVEPMLGPIDLRPHLDYLDQVIVGCESDGPRPGKRKTADAWILDLVDQCDAAGTAVYGKQAEVDGRLVALPYINGRVRAEFPNVNPPTTEQ